MIDSINWAFKVPKRWLKTEKFKKCGKNISCYNYKKDINFTYYDYNIQWLTIMTTTSAVLDRQHIELTEKDMNEYLDKLKEIVCTILVDDSVYNEIVKKITRIDYKLDVFVENEIEHNIYMELLGMLDDKFGHIKEDKKYPTSKVLCGGRYSQREILLYDKYTQSYDKKWKNYIRLETHNRKISLINNLKRNGVSRDDLSNYWQFNMYKEWLIDILDKYMMGHTWHYKIDIAKKIIDNSSYSFTIKKNLKKYLDNVAYMGMAGVRKTYDRLVQQKYKRLLVELGISALTLKRDAPFDKLECLLDKGLKQINIQQK